MTLLIFQENMALGDSFNTVYISLMTSNTSLKRNRSHGRNALYHFPQSMGLTALYYMHNQEIP